MSTQSEVKSQIQKGANPEKAAKRGYEEACEYLEIWNKTILIQQRALACLSKSLAKATIGNSGLLRCEAEMTLQEFAILASLIVQLSVKEGEDFLLKKGTSKDAQGFGPYQNKPFHGSHSKERGSYRKCPYGATSLKAVTNRFPQARGNQISEAPGVVFNPTQGKRVWKHLPPMTPQKPSSVHQ